MISPSQLDLLASSLEVVIYQVKLSPVQVGCKITNLSIVITYNVLP